jgi:RNA polymerase sigma-70 factor, ECF subfamily
LQTDTQLIHDTLRGHPDAYAELVRRYERMVHAAAWAVLRDHHAAQDITQETFLKAYRQLPTLRTPGTLCSWLLTIARRAATDLARSPKRLVSVAVVPETPSLDPPPEEDAAHLLAAVAALPEHEQHVLLLRYFDDLPMAAIAARLDRPVGTITKQLTRAIARLRDRLKELP